MGLRNKKVRSISSSKNFEELMRIRTDLIYFIENIQGAIISAGFHGQESEILKKDLELYIDTLASVEERLTYLSTKNTYIYTPPGAHWLEFADFFFSPKTVREIFKPTIADWREEQFNALKQGRPWKARWISVRYNYVLIKTLGYSKLLSTFKEIFSTIK